MSSSKPPSNIIDHQGVYMLCVHNIGAGGVNKYKHCHIGNMNNKRLIQHLARGSRAAGFRE